MIHDQRRKPLIFFALYAIMYHKGSDVMEFLLELFVEIFGEGIVELIGWSYLKVMQLFVPEKTLTEKARKIIKIAAKTIAIVLFFVLVIGLTLWFQDDKAIKNIGEVLTYVSLSIMAVQIILGIGTKIIRRKRK